MNLQNFEKTDRQILGTSVFLLLLSVLLLWQDGWIYNIVQTKTTNLQEIGLVKSSVSDVRRRHEIALSWLPIEAKNRIYQGDSIFTGNESTVTIKTQKGEEITIAPNSLVVINDKEDSISLDIGFGSIKGKIATGKKLFITSNNNITEISGSNATIQVDAGEGNKLVLNVLSGQVKVNTPTGLKSLGPDDDAEIGIDGQLRSIPSLIQLISPLANQNFLHEADKPLPFRWKTTKKFTRMKIKVASDPEMAKVIVDSRVEDNFYIGYDLPRDTLLYWQILSEVGNSEVLPFALVSKRPPIPILPKTGSQFYFDSLITGTDSGVNVDVSWEQGALTNLFEVQLAKDLAFTQILKTNRTKNKSLTYQQLQSGNYYWRIRSVDFADMPWSETSVFRVGPEPTLLLSPPLAQVEENIFLIPTKKHTQSAKFIRSLSKSASQKYIEDYPRLAWAPVNNAEFYELEIATSRSFKIIIKKISLKQTSYIWRNIEPGQYYWRVRAQNQDYQNGLYSSSQTLKIGVLPPLAISPPVLIEEVPDPKLINILPPPLTLKWQPTVFTQSYEIQFSAQSDFSDPSQLFTKQNSKTVQIRKPGIYFWRVRSLDITKKPVSPFSDTYTIEFQRIYKDPTLNNNLMAIYPRQQDSIILVGNNKSDLEFQWSSKYKDVKYRIEVAADPSFQVVLFSDTTSNQSYTYKEKFQTRVVYWRVRAESDKFNSEWTGINRFLISYEGQPFDFKTSDIMFTARLKAKERQERVIAAQNRKLSKLRSPAASLDLQLDTPQLTEAPSDFTIESNFSNQTDLTSLTDQPLEEFYKQVRKTPMFRWQKVPAAERYVIQIARDRDFKESILKTPVWNPFFNWETVRPGLFYYRIQAFNERYTRSDFSDVRKLEITVTSPTPTSSDTYVEYFDEPRELWQPPSPFVLSWTPIVFARGYEVEFSQEKSFKSAKVFKTKDSKTEFRVSKPGLFFWRVRAINDYGISISEFSQTRSVEILQAQRGPASVYQLTGLFPKNRTVLFVGPGKMNLPFHWADPNNNQQTEIQVSNTKKFNNVIASTKGKKGSAIISQDLPEGKLFWRIKTGTQFSAIEEFFLRREREPYKPSLEQKASR